MPVESRRMDIFSSPNIPDNEQTHVARPFTNTIRGRGVCIQLIFTEEEEEKMKFSFFVLFSPWHRFKYEWGGKFCDMCDGWFSFIFLFFFLLFYRNIQRKKGGEFSDFQRFIVRDESVWWSSGLWIAQLLGTIGRRGRFCIHRRMLDFMPFDVFEVRSGPLYFFFLLLLLFIY